MSVRYVVVDNTTPMCEQPGCDQPSDVTVNVVTERGDWHDDWYLCARHEATVLEHCWCHTVPRPAETHAHQWFCPQRPGNGTELLVHTGNGLELVPRNQLDGG